MASSDHGLYSSPEPTPLAFSSTPSMVAPEPKAAPDLISQTYYVRSSFNLASTPSIVLVSAR